MERRIPQAAPYRALASLCYLFPVAVAMLLLPQYRAVRLLRYHAVQSIALTALSTVFTVALSLVGTLLGPLPVVGITILLGAGLGMSGVIVVGLGLATYAAVLAYDGRLTRIPLLDRWVRRWERMLEPPEEKARRKRQGSTDRLP
jgi:Predicted membrane protein